MLVGSLNIAIDTRAQQHHKPSQCIGVSFTVARSRQLYVKMQRSAVWKGHAPPVAWSSLACKSWALLFLPNSAPQHPIPGHMYSRACSSCLPPSLHSFQGQAPSACNLTCTAMRLCLEVLSFTLGTGKWFLQHTVQPRCHSLDFLLCIVGQQTACERDAHELDKIVSLR